MRQSVSLRLFHCESLNPVVYLPLYIDHFISNCVPHLICIVTHSNYIFDLLAVLIIDHMEPFGDLVRDVLLCDNQQVSDDFFWPGLVVIVSLLRHTDPHWPCIWADAACPGSSPHVHHFSTIIHPPSRGVKACCSRHSVCRNGISL
jgi:hypothetical protein